MRDIGKNIRTIRTARNMTQDALAEALFVTRQTVSNYENGRSRPDLDMLLRIAEVFGTDINTVIYGPPVPEDKKRAYRYLVAAVILLAVTGVSYLVLDALFSNPAIYHSYCFSGRLLNKYCLLPTAMFLLGWGLLHALGIFCNLRQLQHKAAAVGKVILLVLIVIMIAVALPFNIWLFAVTYRSFTEDAVSMSFPYIPVYQQVLWGIEMLILRAPYVFSLLGGACWLFGLPDLRKNRPND